MNTNNTTTSVSLIAVFFVLLPGCCFASAQATADVFVAPNGNDSWSGKLPAPNATGTDGPFASVAGAQAAVRKVIATRPGRFITVMVRGGTYYLPGTLMFDAADSGASSMPVIWQNYPGETPILSGGVAIGNSWNHVSGRLWKVELPAKTRPFEYLFYNGERRLRARLQSASGTGYFMRGKACYSTATKQIVDMSLCNLGSFLRVAAEVAPERSNAGCPSVTDTKRGSKSKCLDRFAYDPKDPIANWSNLNPGGSFCRGPSSSYPVGDIELTLFNAWTVDMMRVSCVDTRSHMIYLTGPVHGGPNVYSFFGPAVGHRYMIENVKDAFESARTSGQDGVWFLDRSASPWMLNYLARQGEDPNRDRVVIPQLQPANGSLLSASNVSYVTFRGITFEMDNYVPPAAGFNNDENGESSLPQAIDCESCQHVVFDGITVRHTSASGILIASASGNSGPAASDDTIENSAFYDIGDSGIRIGHHPAGSDKAENVVQSVMVRNNVIAGYSRVFADGEGIAQGNGHDITYSHNDISDGYHAGLSVCLMGCASHEANGTRVISEYNHIWNVMQGITSDGGTLYYNVGMANGSGSGNKILHNLLHDTTDSSIIDEIDGVRFAGTGYGGEGIYLDNQTAGVDVEDNVVYRVSGAAAWMTEGPARGQPANNFRNNIFAFARKTMFNEGQPWPQGCAGASLRVNIISNVFYFDRNDAAGFFPVNGCAWSCGLDYNKFQNFQGNLYWRTDGQFASDAQAFHVMTSAPPEPNRCSAPGNPKKAWTFVGFAEWRDGRMNEDAGSTVMTDPGFGKSGKPGDYLLNKSPVAGFDYARTNDTIQHAGREHPVIMPPKAPATFPTYSYKEF